MESDVDVRGWVKKQCHWCLWPRQDRLVFDQNSFYSVKFFHHLEKLKALPFLFECTVEGLLY